MELVESIEYINEQLISLYGNEPYADDLPRFKVVFSDSELEKRWVTHTGEGFELLYPEVREVPKYRHYIKAKYILERLVPIDVENTDLTTKVGYEPAHVFMTPQEKYLPPRLDMCVVAINRLLEISSGNVKPAKQSDPASDPTYYADLVKRMQENLFGNETDTGDALAYREGVVNPAGSEHFTETQQNDSTQKVEKSGEQNVT